MSETFDNSDELGEKLLEMTDRAKVAHTMLPGAFASMDLEVDGTKFKIDVKVVSE